MESEKNKRIRLNTFSSFFLQITSIICGFLVPRLVLREYGSEVYGLINSISQFLLVVSFMEMGIGAVVQSSLYKPLTFDDNETVSKILKSAQEFFRTIAIVLLGYILLLMLILPHLAKRSFDTWYTVMLVFAIGANSFFQYFIGMPERLLLLADQKGYIHYLSQTIILVVNTLVSVILIKHGAKIQTVKFVSALVFLLRPICLRIYVNKHYLIDRSVKYDNEPINQKWNGIAQHVAAVVLDQTDVVVLTFFSTLSNVSIYSVYHLVTFGIKSLFISLMGGIQPLMGEYIAKNYKDKLSVLFDWTEWLIHTGTTAVFVCAGVLIVPFVEVYTKGVNDANYIVPVFATLIVIANAGHCLRLPYNIMILAAGHYKQTQHNYIIAAAMNVFVSVLSVKQWGLVGVAVGTVAAMLYQTVWMAYYDSKYIIEYPISRFWKHILVDIVIASISVIATMPMTLKRVDYSSWILLAVQKCSICFLVTTIINVLFYFNMMKSLKDKTIHLLKNMKDEIKNEEAN